MWCGRRRVKLYSSCTCMQVGWAWARQVSMARLCKIRSFGNRFQCSLLATGYLSSPAGAGNCCDDAEWLIDNDGGRFGATLGFVGSESAGAHLTLLTA